MVDSKEAPAPDRVQRKRVQNREAQQKYRNRVRERLHAMEKQIEELKSSSKVKISKEPQRQITTAAVNDNILSKRNESAGTETQKGDGSYVSTSPDTRSSISPNIEETHDENQAYASKSRRLANREGSSSESERSRIRTSFHRAAPTTQVPSSTSERALQGTIGTYASQQSIQTRHSGMSYLAPEAFPDLLWLPTSQTYTRESDDDTTKQCPIEGSASGQAKGAQSRLEKEIPESLLLEDIYDFQNCFQEQGRLSIGGDTEPTRSPQNPSGTDLYDESHSFLALDMASELLPEDAYADQARLTYAEIKSKLQSQSLEKRFEYLRLCLSAAGFSTFDTMASQYYTADFSHESIMSSEQRISRQRQLPPLLAELRQHVKTWTQWEAHGYCDEIIKSTESIIVSERGDSAAIVQREYSNTLLELVIPWQGAIDGGGNGMSTSALQPLMRMFQETIPKLLALVESLTSTSEMSNPRERFYTTIALVVLLNRPQKLSKWQMVSIMMTCLDMIYGSSR